MTGAVLHDEAGPSTKELPESNRRMDRRVPMSYRAHLRAADADTPLPVPVTIEDVSENGMGIRSPRELKPGYYLISLQDGKGEPQEVSYQLQWCRRGTTGWDCGLRMVEYEERCRVAAIKWAARRRRELPAKVVTVRTPSN